MNDQITQRRRKPRVEPWPILVEHAPVASQHEAPTEQVPTLPSRELGTVWAEGWLCEGWPPSAPDPRWAR